MAKVYQAHDPRLHRRVALKVLKVEKPPEAPDPDVPSDASIRVLREARASASLNHPNAVSVFDVGEADGQLFIAMELVVGKSLRAFVGDAAVPWETKLRWMVDAARALGAAHDRGLVHRDVKPENIMVRNDGVVKVLDFGIAKRVFVDVGGAGTLDEWRTQSIHGRIIGTPWYASPEQLRGDLVDGRADQFSWGVTTYELLTGMLPWPKGVDGFQLVLAILNKTPEAPSKVSGVLPSIVDATIMKAMAKAASQRFDAMDSIVAALEGLASPSRRSWAEIHPGATTKTDPAPPMPMPTPVSPTTDGATTLPTEGGPSSSLARPAAAAAAAMALATLLGLVSARLVHGASDVPAAIPTADTSSSPPAVPLTSLPAPKSAVPEAIAAYRAFQQSFRDADWSSAMRALETAVDRDPSMGAAHLRLAFLHSLEAFEEGRVRTSFHAAVRNRAGLDEHDMALLDALEPYLQREPSDPMESEQRLESLRARWPGDAEIAYVLGSVRYDRGDIGGALDAFIAASGIDPAFAQALSSKGGCLAYLGRFDEARATLDQVLRLSPTATEALWYQAQIHEQQGRCADEEATVRAWLARDPDDAFAYTWLANALAAEGKPADTVRTALEQKWVRVDADSRAKREPVDLANVDILMGDFASAERRLHDLEKLLAAEPGAQVHAESQATLLRIAQETGSVDHARAVAESYLARKDAWSPPHRVDDVSIFLDPVPMMLGALASAGAIPAGQVDSQRDDWLRARRAKTGTGYLGDLWVAAWAIPANTRDQAVAALAALPQFGGLPAFTPTMSGIGYAGHVYLLADRLDEAVAALRSGATSCTVLAEGIPNTHAWMELGTALEAKGDHDGACDAYRVVLSRWGHAKPRSITADAARAHSSALGCH